MTSPLSREQTLLVLHGSEGITLVDSIRSHLLKSGFVIRLEETLSTEDLDEVGLDMGEVEQLHLTIVLEKEQAVKELKDLLGRAGSLNKRELSAMYPELRFIASPTISAAEGTISLLFPQLPPASEPKQGSSISSSPHSSPSNAMFFLSDSNTTPSKAAIRVPHVLSNESHPSPPPKKELSPSMLRALERSLASGEGQDYEESSEPNNEDAASETEHFEAEEILEDDVFDEDQEVLILAGSASNSGAFSHPPRPISAQSISSFPTSPTSATSQTFRTDSTPASFGSPHPRLTKTAALRLGITLPSRSSSANSTVEITPTPSPRIIATPKSLAAPTITPRATKASALRAGNLTTTPTRISSESSASSAKPITKSISKGTADRSSATIFSDTPGHKRRESIQVASTLRPKIEVRMTKGSNLRAGIESPVVVRRKSIAENKAPEGYGCTFGSNIVGNGTGRNFVKPATTSRPRSSMSTTTSASIRSSSTSLSKASASAISRVMGGSEAEDKDKRSARPSIEPRMTKTSSMRTGAEVIPVEKRRASVLPNGNYDGVPGHPRPSIVLTTSARPPTFEPRINRTTLLRQGIPAGSNHSSASPSLSMTSSRFPSTKVAHDVSPVLSATSSFSSPVATKRRESTLSGPTPMIVPRSNRTAELRTLKKQKDEEALRKASAMVGGLRRVKSSALGNLPN